MENEEKGDEVEVVLPLSPSLVEAIRAGGSGREIVAVCLELAEFLIEKNNAYGDSALSPLRICSKAHPAEQIRVRMDDKLSRLFRGQTGDEDALKDLVGYWVLMRVLERRQLAVVANCRACQKYFGKPCSDHALSP